MLKKIVGTAERPRLHVTRIEPQHDAQIVDDTKGVTTAAQ